MAYLHASGELAIGDTLNDAVHVFDSTTYAFLRQFSIDGADPGLCAGFRALAATSSDHVAVAENTAHRVQVLTAATGQLLRSSGTRGCGDGQFENVTRVACSSCDSLYASDMSLRRVQLFGSDGRFVRVVALTSGSSFIRPTGISCFADDSLVVVD